MPVSSPEDTIVAIATPPGRGGIGIVRLSGPAALKIAEALVRRSNSAPWQPRRATRAELLDHEASVIDDVLVTYFPEPKSYTAEDVVEISCHGSPVVLGLAVERALDEGARLAEPGEFTQRAFFHGRIDLAQAEAVRDLIEATTLYQARVATQQAHGSLSHRIAPLKSQLLDLIALLEAGIDFAEDDVDVATAEEVFGRLGPLAKATEDLADSFRYGKVVRGGITIAILGKPNVGKSSLFNRLLEQDRAIVAAQPGTTRDWVTEFFTIKGLPVKIIDTAGIRATSDVIEAQGVQKSYEALAGADLILAVIDLSQPLGDTDRELLVHAGEQRRCLVVGNKRDLPQHAKPEAPWLAVSATTGEGIDALREAIHEAAVPRLASGQEAAFVTNIRQAGLLKDALVSLRRAEQAVAERVPHEMLLLDLYSALQPIDQITGATTIEDILRHIFSTFCIGK